MKKYNSPKVAKETSSEAPDVASPFGELNKKMQWKIIGNRKMFGKYNKILCVCSCGNKKYVDEYSIKIGGSLSCGCAAKRTHGMSKTKLYRVFVTMHRRCYDVKNLHYSRYGGSGIKVCPEWHSSCNFIEWALKNGYKEGLSIDRINPYGDYTPKNCRWTNIFVQQHNHRERKNKKLPQGVHKNIFQKKFFSAVTINNKQIYLGSYHTSDDASKEYKKEKSNIVNFLNTGIIKTNNKKIYEILEGMKSNELF